MKLYNVNVGMPGYMPDNTFIYRTLGAARDGAQEWADWFRNEWDDDTPRYRVSGNKREGYEVMRRDASTQALPIIIYISLWDATDDEVTELQMLGEIA